ncbi:MAG: hypothetical protein JNL60_06705, partial [Bacteroidia bacterium]|nr:hypothetical protein [Bacteroidia bacterium]
MKTNSLYFLVVGLMLYLADVRAQNQCAQWYFGQNGGLNFLTNPPTSQTGSLITQEGCASVANAAGSLLFYTDGITIYDATHATMANGSGLWGHSSSTQAAVIVKQPGNSNIYFVFTTDAQGFSNGLCYSVVDMNLAAGLGSVTIKNVQLTTPVSEKLASVRHCNGVDIWAVAHDYNSNVFRAYLVTSTGVNTTAVTSTVGSNASIAGAMKFSPNGQKLGMAIYPSSYELFDFDASTGIVSNVISLTGMGGYGCEFSPDGTKLYGSTPGKIGQWDICAGSATAIAASFYSVTASSNWGLQLGQDGYIYVSRLQTSSLGIIYSPNSLGSAMNYTDAALSISPNQCRLGLPNFFSSYFKTPPTPFTTSVNPNFGCYTASFSTSYNPSVTTVGCVSSGYSLTGLQWNFGDPPSGANNVSNLQNPTHSFSGMGTYTVSLILYYSCGGGTDTIKQPVVINLPCISVNSTSITCASLGSATVQALGSPGPFSYTWMPTGQTNPVATGLSPGAYTITVHDLSNNFTYTAQTVFTSLIPLTGNINMTSSVSCNGAATGTGNITNIAGGSGNQTYLWTNGSVTYTTNNVNSLSAGIWTTQAKDLLTGCQFSLVSLVTQPPAMNLVLSSNTPTACAGRSITLSGLNSGGTPSLVGAGYTYTWSGGPVSNTQTVSNAFAGTYVYTLTSKDSLNCQTSKTIAVDFVPNPTVSVSNVSICPLQVGTLYGFGGTSYTWTSPTLSATGSSFN